MQFSRFSFWRVRKSLPAFLLFFPEQHFRFVLFKLLTVIKKGFIENVDLSFSRLVKFWLTIGRNSRSSSRWIHQLTKKGINEFWELDESLLPSQTLFVLLEELNYFPLIRFLLFLSSHCWLSNLRIAQRWKVIIEFISFPTTYTRICQTWTILWHAKEDPNDRLMKREWTTVILEIRGNI